MTENNKKPWYKKWWAIVIYVFLGLIILGNLLGSEEVKEVPQNEEQEIVEDNKASEANELYSIGEQINAGDLNWKITKFSTSAQIGQDIAGTFFGENANGIFLILDVEVENVGKKAKYLSDSFITLVDEQEREFSANTMAAIYLKPDGSALAFEQINPGIVKKGKIVFDIPAGTKIANVRIRSNLFETSSYEVELLIKE